ncbi:hypothetical protein BJ508DRAFT_362614 [Ascobolus immersus RN42]|uniref:Uncharacterized protein n=1 Tax=Ascobolus immersus RN42 TaxID=1160509 RepID=A0A3N4I8H3_ASCIM|nr:hypothetical protein BJ508DRAFT_362614 [Ascobolus immersus RN42]
MVQTSPNPVAVLKKDLKAERIAETQKVLLKHIHTVLNPRLQSRNDVHLEPERHNAPYRWSFRNGYQLPTFLVGHTTKDSGSTHFKQLVRQWGNLSFAEHAEMVDAIEKGDMRAVRAEDWDDKPDADLTEPIEETKIVIKKDETEEEEEKEEEEEDEPLEPVQQQQQEPQQETRAERKLRKLQKKVELLKQELENERQTSELLKETLEKERGVSGRKDVQWLKERELAMKKDEFWMKEKELWMEKEKAWMRKQEQQDNPSNSAPKKRKRREE